LLSAGLAVKPANLSGRTVINMAIRVDHVRSALADYLDQHPEAKTELRVILGLLEDSDGLTSRKTIPGHVTASARSAFPRSEAGPNRRLSTLSVRDGGTLLSMRGEAGSSSAER
jgi:hypothetical protein